jgi:guanine deaminase
MLIYRSRIFTPIADATAQDETSWRYWENGYLAIDDGKIVSVGSWDDRPDNLNGEVVQLGSDNLVTPGFVDTHLHGPQLEMIGSYGGHLLEWLERYTFPTEAKFADEDHARRVARAFYPELLRNGTTTALIFSTIHMAATNIFFEEAASAGFRAIIGKTMMDRNAPSYLLESAQTSYDESKALIEKWQGNDLLAYAVTPRFAPTSTETLLALAGSLKQEFPDCYVQTHVSENLAEVEWVRELFPSHLDYVSVYEHHGLVGDRTILAHGVHLGDGELARLAARGARIAHCPNSNLFLGSGLFPMKRVRAAGVLVGLGTDIGAGTTPSLFNAMADAYKVQQVQGNVVDPFQLWYLATLAGARALSLDDRIGSLEPGKEADFIVLDLHATPLLEMRTLHTKSVEDLLAGLIFMGDDRLVRKTFIRGREVSRRI